MKPLLKQLLQQFLKFLSCHWPWKGKVLVGIRCYLFGGNGLVFLNTPLSWIDSRVNFTEIQQLHDIANELGRPVDVCSWFRDFSGSTTNGAYYEKIGVTVYPNSSEEELQRIRKSLGERVSGFCLVSPSGINKLNPISEYSR